MAFRAKWQTTALNSTCTLETGSAVTAPIAETSGVACMEVPPTDYEDDTMLKLLIEDTAGTVAIGDRFVYQSQRYLIRRIQRDGTFALLFSKTWEESLT